MSKTSKWTSFRAEGGCLRATATDNSSGHIGLCFTPISKSKPVNVNLTREQFAEAMLVLEDIENFIDDPSKELGSDEALTAC